MSGAADGRSPARDALEVELRESRERLRDYLETASDWLWETDERFVVTFVSDGAAARGFVAERLVGRTRWERAGVTAPASHPAWRRHLEDLRSHRPFRDFTYELPIPGEASAWIAVSGRPFFTPEGRFLGYRGTSRDVTERVAAEAALEAKRRENDVLRRAIDALPDVLYCKDRDGRFLVANLATALAVGVADPAKLVGLTDADLHPPELARRYREDEERVVAEGAPALLEQPALRPDGGEAWVWSLKAPLRDEAGAVVGLIGHGRDITEYRRQEKALAQARGRLERQADEMRRLAEAAQEASRAKSEFLARMSHEIRSPMNAVLGFAGLLAGSRLDEEQRRHVGVILETGRQLLGILNDVLDLSKLEAGRAEVEPAPFRLDELLASTRPFAEILLAEKAVAFELAVHPALPSSVRGDAVRLRQVLTNLLSNAARFTDQGSVRLAVSPASAAQTGAARPVRFEVSDTGVGIAPERLQDLFRPFSQVGSEGARHRGGTGLGLAISQHLVELMGGRIDIDSAPGRGTSFSFEISLQAVDDMATNRELMQALLAAAGHEVRAVGGGSEAVEAVREEPPDLVLMDVSMPGMDGLEATRRIRALGGVAARVPVVALTAHAFASDVEACREAGMDGHLAKPIGPAALHAALARYAPGRA